MHQFYFNECLPSKEIYISDFALLLETTITEFKSLVKSNIGVDKGIILEKETERTVVCGNDLKSAILSIMDKEIRTLAFEYFTRCPIQYHLKSDEIDDKLLDEEHHFEGVNATNLAIAKHYDCFLFSIAVLDCIKKNSIKVEGKSEIVEIDNLYGEKQNTQYIESKILKINAISLELFDQLKAELKNVIYTAAFEKAFKSARSEVQQSIIENFAAAPSRKLKTPYFPDNKERGLIKDVTPDNNRKKAKVYELRIYHPDALRVYFYEFDNTIFISSIGYKKDYKDGNAQSKHIESSLNDIDKLIKTR